MSCVDSDDDVIMMILMSCIDKELFKIPEASNIETIFHSRAKTQGLQDLPEQQMATSIRRGDEEI